MLLQPLTLSKEESSKPLRHWRARLELSFHAAGERTRLSHCAHEGPLRVQRLFYPEPTGKAHCYLLHPPGGVVLGDELSMHIALQSGEALVTTPSAGRFYTVDQHAEEQQQSVHLSLAAGKLEWLPQETILFNGVNARLKTRIDLSKIARLAFWDVVVLGRPACHEPFTSGRLEQSLEIYRDGNPLLIERLALNAGDRISQARMGLNGHSTLGIMVLTDIPSKDVIDNWLTGVNKDDSGDGHDGEFSVTQRGSLLIARYLGECAFKCRQGFSQLWISGETALRGRPPAIPRIWHT